MLKTACRVLAGGLAVLLLCEGVLRVLPVSTSTATGYYVDPLILTYPPGHRWTMSTGWQLHNPQQLHANNAGFVAEHDFVADPAAIALVGDSFIEASQLDATDRPAEQLRRALGGRPVYAMGSPGSSLLDYAERIRFARAAYGIRDVVVMVERSDVRQSLCGSRQIHGPCLDSQTGQPRTQTVPPPGTLKKLLRHVALAQYFAGHLKFDLARLFSRSSTTAEKNLSPAPSAPRDEPRVPPGHDAVTALFFERVRQAGIARLILVMDSDREAIYAGRPPDAPGRARFMQLAREAGAVVVDLQPVYAASFAGQALKLEVGPYDAHLNALGVKLAMGAASAALLGRTVDLGEHAAALSPHSPIAP